jgi:hypothetical protein
VEQTLAKQLPFSRNPLREVKIIEKTIFFLTTITNNG